MLLVPIVGVLRQIASDRMSLMKVELKSILNHSQLTLHVWVHMMLQVGAARLALKLVTE